MTTKQTEVQIPAAVFTRWADNGLMQISDIVARKGRAVIFNVDPAKAVSLIEDCNTQLANKADLREPYRRALKATVQRLAEITGTN